MAFLSFLAGTLGVLGVAGAHFRYLSPAFGFYLAMIAIVVIALNFPLNLVRFVRRGKRYVSPGGMLFGLLAIAALGVVFKFAIENPITDVTNAPAAPPRFQRPLSTIPVPAAMQEFMDPTHQLSREYNPAFAAKQERVYPNIYQLALPVAPPAAFQIVQSVVNKHPEWKKVRANEADLSLELEEELPVIHAVDDFVISVVPAGAGSHTLLRSRSRFGFTDFGFNAKRIRQFSDEFVAAGAAMNPPMKVEFVK